MLAIFTAALLAASPFASAFEQPLAGPRFARWLHAPDVNTVSPAAPAAVKSTETTTATKRLAQAPKPEAKPAGDAAALVDRVQRFYESTADFSASFDQTYRYTAMGRTVKSSGTVQVKKPGLMRWDYTKPHAKSFVLDGKSLWLYEPDDHAVMVNRAFSSDALSAAVTFLWGKGKLTDEFTVTKAERSDYGPTVLELAPKRAQSGFTRLFFVLDEKTGAVATSIVIDSQANENRIAFSNVKTNQGLDAKRFHFEIPKGAAVSEWK